MIEKTISEEKRYFCDFCKKRINVKNVDVKCICCKKDVCLLCSYGIIETIKERTYTYKTKKISRICKKCFKKIKEKK